LALLLLEYSSVLRAAYAVYYLPALEEPYVIGVLKLGAEAYGFFIDHSFASRHLPAARFAYHEGVSSSQGITLSLFHHKA
jgi:hypothetical protein